MGYIGNAPYQGVITGANIQDGTVDTADIANDAVTTVKITDANITEGKLNAGAVTTTKIADGAVTAAKLAAGAAVPSQTGQSGKYLTTDGSTASWGTVDLSSKVAKSGDTMTGDLSFGDTKKAIFGAGSDLQIYHTGSNSILKSLTGEFLLQGDGITLRGDTPTETMLTAAVDGAVTLHYDSLAKLATTSTGIDVTGTVTAASFSGDGSQLTNVIADGAVTAAKLASTLDLSGKTVTLPNNATNLDYVQPVNVGYQAFADNTGYNLANMSIPSAGVWFIWTHLRWGFNNSSQFTRIRVDGANSSNILWKMQVERIGTSTPNSNVSLTSNFIVEVGSGNTFPYTLRLYAYKSGTGTLFLQNDSNGYNAFGALKIAKTSVTTATMSQKGY